MIDRARFRGQPLLLLGGMLGLWVAMRVATWQVHFELPAARAPGPVPPIAAPARSGGEGGSSGSATAVIERGRPVDASAPARRSALPPVYSTEPLPRPWQTSSLAAPSPVPAQVVAAPVAPRGAIAHNLMLFAGLAQMEVPRAILSYLNPPVQPARAAAPAAPFVARPATQIASSSRWSGDAWLLWREGGLPGVAAQPSYGRSQAGAVVRYRLADNAARPQAFLRASSALQGPRDPQAAVGLSARPLARVPVRVAVEARLSDTAGGTEVRPAAYAVTELAPVKLPAGLRGEVYGQAGYVGGKFATAFVDGQARLERPLINRRDLDLSAGAGLWGGAQKGASRLDVGPTAALSFRLGDGRGRVAADYRFRVAGDAAPASGPSLTLSAGF